MANIKISNLEQTNITNPDTSFVMVVAQDENSGLYRNYRISLNELRRIIGSIEGDIVTGVTEAQVIEIVNNAILADNNNELTEDDVKGMINDSISRIELPSPGVSEERINTLIQEAISADNQNELQESRVQEMIDNSITADNLKDAVEEVVPDVIPSVIPSAEIQVEATNEPIVLTVKEVAEKVVVQENTVTEITKEIKEDCVCKDHADDCFNTIFS